tara:strand:- start:477 stop:779 length:303 start_codon:yes stop_codon:yes gene_type:complete
MLFFLFLLATGNVLAFTIKLTGSHSKVPPCRVRDAMTGLNMLDLQHVEIYARQPFFDECIVDATVYATNGNRFCSTARGGHFLSALRSACQQSKLRPDRT